MIRVVTQTLKIATIVLVSVAVVAASAGFFNYWSDRSRADDIGRPVTIQITSDDDTSSVAKKLTDAELVNYGVYFEARMRLSGGELKPGTYTLRKGQSVAEIIDQITVSDAEAGTGTQTAQGDTPSQSFQITFIEGQRIGEFADKLEEAGFPNGRQAFLDAVANPANRQGFDFLQGLPSDASLEGFLFPDTYTVGAGETADQLVIKMLNNFDTKFTPEMRQQLQASGLTMLQAITIASIVEREAAVADERPIIAKVYLNRLDQGMLLNADPTLQYMAGAEGDWWPKVTTAMMETDSPYNTNIYTGLPPGPISNPGLASIQSVLQPADVTYLYFVAKDDGSGTHEFANTNEEQNQNRCTYAGDCSDAQGGDSSTKTPTDTSGDGGG
ncbi:MAG: endolytic transglycosylase MltG [Thermomicrobiales bacterium]